MSLEERVAMLEREVADLKRRVATDSVGSSHRENNHGTPDTSWIQEISGSMKDFPEFDEVVRLGRELRQHDLLETLPIDDS